MARRTLNTQPEVTPDQALEEAMSSGVITEQARTLLQDALGRRTRTQLRDEYEAMDTEGRRRFLWITFSVMGMESALDIARATVLEMYAVQVHDLILAQHQAEWAKIDEARQALNNERNRLMVERQELLGELTDAKAQVDQLNRLLDATRADRKELENELQDARRDYKEAMRDAMQRVADHLGL